MWLPHSCLLGRLWQRRSLSIHALIYVYHMVGGHHMALAHIGKHGNKYIARRYPPNATETPYPTEKVITHPFNDHIRSQMVMEGCSTNVAYSIWRVMSGRWNTLPTTQCPQGYPCIAKPDASESPYPT